MAEQGPFRRGEILTAQKLNEALTGRPITVSGSGRLSRDAKGDVVTVDQPETIYLRLTGKTGTTPIKYSWKEVYRNAAGAWVNTARTGTTSGDYAIELNNSDLSTTDNLVYRAERSPESGEWLFFSRSGTVSACNCSLILLTDSGVTSGCNITYDANHYGLSAWGASGVPDWFAMANATLSWADGASPLTVLKVWDSANTTKPVAYSWELPYIPTANRPMTFRYDIKFKQDSALGIVNGNCFNINSCKGNVTINQGPRDPSGAISHGFHVKGTVLSSTSGNVTYTSAPGPQIGLDARVTVSGNIQFLGNTLPVPEQWFFSNPGITAYGPDVEAWFANELPAVTTGTTGGPTYYVDSGFQTIPNTTYRGLREHSAIIYGCYDCDYDTVGVWPPPFPKYKPGLTQINIISIATLFTGGGITVFSSYLNTNILYKHGTTTYETITRNEANITHIARPDAVC